MLERAEAGRRFDAAYAAGDLDVMDAELALIRDLSHRLADLVAGPS